MLQKVPSLRSQSIPPAGTCPPACLNTFQEPHHHLITLPLQAPKLVNSSNSELSHTQTSDGKANLPYVCIGYSHGAGILCVLLAEWK